MTVEEKEAIEKFVDEQVGTQSSYPHYVVIDLIDKYSAKMFEDADHSLWQVNRMLDSILKPIGKNGNEK